MAIARDTSTDGGLANPATSLSFNHTCTGTNLILFVTAFGDTQAGDATGTKITGATYATVAMTLVDKMIFTNDRWVYLFILVAPATGTNSVAINASASIAINGHAVSYTGAKQTGQPDNQNKDEKSVNDAAIAPPVTTLADNCWLVGAFRSNLGGGAPSAGTTELRDSNGLYTADSNGPKTPTGSYSIGYPAASTFGGAGWAAVCASFAPAVAAAAKRYLLVKN